MPSPNQGIQTLSLHIGLFACLSWCGLCRCVGHVPQGVGPPPATPSYLFIYEQYSQIGVFKCPGGFCPVGDPGGLGAFVCALDRSCQRKHSLLDLLLSKEFESWLFQQFSMPQQMLIMVRHVSTRGHVPWSAPT